MARTVPAAITNALALTGQQPTLAVTAQDYINRFSQVAGGMTAGRTSSIITGNGTLLVAVCTQGADPNTIQLARLTSVTAGNWTAARSTIATTAAALAGCCLAVTGTTIRCFYQKAADLKIYYVQSTNDGVTWGAETVTQNTVPLGLGNFCFGIMADGINSIWAAYASYNNRQGNCNIEHTVFTTSWSAWSSVGPASPTWGLVRGLAMVTVAGNRRVLAGVQLKAGLKGISASTATWNGATWTAWTALQNWDNPDLGISLSWPGLFYDSGSGTYYAAVMETDDGSVSGTAQTRLNVFTSTDFVNWNIWQSFGTAFQYGAQVAVVAGVLSIFDGSSVYSAPSASSATDLSDDVLGVTIHESENSATIASIMVSNQLGQWNAHPSIRTDAKIQVSLGYDGTTVLTHTLIIDRYTYTATATEQILTIQCRDALKLLDYAQHRLLVYRSQALSSIITDVCLQAKVTLGSLPVTAQFSSTVPCFLITPGETWLQALERLSKVYTFVYFVDETMTLRVQERSVSDASTWTYGSEVLAVTSSYSADQANVIRVVGSAATVFNTVIDGTNLLSVGRERYRQVVDRLLDTAAKCAIKGALLLRDEQAGAYDASLVVAINPTHQVNDVITFTDSGVGAGSQRARITHLQTQINTGTGEWLHTLHCTGV